MNGIEGALSHVVTPLANNSESISTGASDGRSTRVIWLVYLSAVALGCILAFYSVIFMRADFLEGAIVSGAVVLVARSVLKERMTASGSDTSAFGEETISEMESLHEERVGVSGLVQLLREWQSIERARGTVDFDPWALQNARNEIRLAVEADPTLERLFRPRG